MVFVVVVVVVVVVLVVGGGRTGLPVFTWPRISPAGFFAVCTFT